MARVRSLRVPSVESLFVATFALLGFRLGLNRIGDNSMFVHVRTGIDMVAGRGIPRHDPYSFTAHGTPWVVQSWLASWTYGWADRLGGTGLLTLEQGVLLGVLAWLVARLARTGSALRTALAAAAAVGVGFGYWSQRPLLFGLIGFALLVTVVERRLSPWWLIPILWVWVNTHGSFPLGALWLGAVVVGAAFDQRRVPTEYIRYVVGFVAGLAVSVLNPIGPRLLWFPLAVGEKRSIFKSVVEWRSPNFQTPGGLVALVFLAVALVLLCRARLGWRDVIPVVGFVALGLLALRNVPLVAIVLAPVLGRALAVSEPVHANRINAAIAAVLAVAFVGFGAAALATAKLDLHEYPVAATRWLDQNGYFTPDKRVAEQDVVGCYLDLRYGRRGVTFIDDRVDMFPLAVSKDYQILLEGKPKALAILDHRRIDAVLWDSEQPLVTILKATGKWRETYHHAGWSVLVRA